METGLTELYRPDNMFGQRYFGNIMNRASRLNPKHSCVFAEQFRDAFDLLCCLSSIHRSFEVTGGNIWAANGSRVELLRPKT